MIDSSNPHLWHVRFTPQTDLDEYKASFAEVMALNPNKTKFAVLIDMSSSKLLTVTSSARREAADMMARHQDWFSQTLVGAARIAPDPILRGVLTVYDFIAPGRWPRKSFTSGEAAEAWARGLLQAASIECDPAPVWR